MVLELLCGYMTTQCLYVVVQLCIADYIVAEEKTIDELARLTNCNADALYRVMRCFAYQGVFEEKENKIFQINDEAKLLVSTNPNTLNHFICVCSEELYQAAGSLLQTVQQGIPAFDYRFKTDFWSYLNNNPVKSKLFSDAMENGFNNTLSEILNSYDFTTAKKIIDVGGGKGHLLCSILKNNIDADGVVYDLSYLESQANDCILKSNLSSRCQFIKGDFFQTIPKNGDLYLLRVILHDWDDQKAIIILKNCRKAIFPTGKLIIIEKVMINGEHQLSTYFGDINMLVALTGKERSVKEYETLLNKSGFQLKQCISTKTAYSIIEAIPS